MTFYKDLTDKLDILFNGKNKDRPITMPVDIKMDFEYRYLEEHCLKHGYKIEFQDKPDYEEMVAIKFSKV